MIISIIAFMPATRDDKGNLPQPMHLRKFKIQIFHYVCSSKEKPVRNDIRKKQTGDYVL
jgi:hypothetical protein